MSFEKKVARFNFITSVFHRDNWTCMICGIKEGAVYMNGEKIDAIHINAHHITSREDMPNGGYVKENGITLCDRGTLGCHYRAEMFLKGLTNDDVKVWSPEALYKKINSSYEIAFKRASEKNT